MVLNEQDPNASLRSLFSSWEMPALRRLSVSGFIPILRSTSMRGLTCFRLKLNGSVEDETSIIMRIGPLAEVLQSLIALEELYFEFINVEEIIDAELFSIEFPHLKRLKFSPNIMRIETIRSFFLMISGPFQDITWKDRTEDSFGVLAIQRANFNNEMFRRWRSLKTLDCSLIASELFDPSGSPSTLR